ncbi:histidine phosphatase family protein [Desulfosarcina sp.]|uniref:histidine phosphatase family protein n=1 Tax=Desulfosarcina sp. TaxID=2027861 RepID=UPI003563A372
MSNSLKTWLMSGREKKIMLLRHGELLRETEERRFIGQTDLPLSHMGRRQAKYWCKCLSDVPIAHIISSDLSRCMESARILCAARPIIVKPLARLREINLGGWDGMTFRRVRERWPDAFGQRGTEMARFRPPGGESFLDLQQRVVPAFEQAVDQAAGNLLMVAHAGVNRMILCHLLGMPPENLFRIAQGCGAMNLIDRQTGGFRIQAINLLPPF